MAKTIRLSDKEEEQLIKTLLKVNTKLIRLGMIPMKDTELFHEVFKLIFMKGRIELSKDGELKVI